MKPARRNRETKKEGGNVELELTPSSLLFDSAFAGWEKISI